MHICIFESLHIIKMVEQLTKLYREYTNCEPEQIDEMPASGSGRRYFRLHGEPTLIGVCGESEAENKAFLYMARHFKSKGLPVPQVVAQSADGMCYLQEDLGDTLLFKAIEKGRLTHVFSEEEKEATIARLEESMLDAAEHLDFEKAAKLRDQLLALKGEAPMINAEKSRKKRRTREKMTHRHSQ